MINSVSEITEKNCCHYSFFVEIQNKYCTFMKIQKTNFMKKDIDSPLMGRV